MQVLRRELTLHIDDFGKENTLNELVRNYHTCTGLYLKNEV